MSDYIEERDESVSGTAQSISYDRNGTVRLTGQATLVIGDNEVMGCEWVYNVIEKTYETGATDDCDGVTIILAPPEESDDLEGQTETL